ncbi:hypothetical protein CI102_12239 [Trichoderma harzianum]|nr:hypothetical protein CI102_12239 [Trichoderma harzianum]
MAFEREPENYGSACFAFQFFFSSFSPFCFVVFFFPYLFAFCILDLSSDALIPSKSIFCPYYYTCTWSKGGGVRLRGERWRKLMFSLVFAFFTRLTPSLFFYQMSKAKQSKAGIAAGESGGAGVEAG